MSDVSLVFQEMKMAVKNMVSGGVRADESSTC